MAAPTQDLQLFVQTRLPLLSSAPCEACMDTPSFDADVADSTDSTASADNTVCAVSDAQHAATPDESHGSTSSSPAPLLRRFQSSSSVVFSTQSPPCLELLPNEVLILIASFLDVDDLLRTSRTCRRLRKISLDPVVHQCRLRETRFILRPFIASPCRPSLADLMSRSIFLTNNTVISRRLARSLVSIRLARRLSQRPDPESLVQRAVLPRECVPGMFPVFVAPSLVAKRKAIEKERLKDGLRRWIACKWKEEVREREEDVKRCDESHGVGRVWRLRHFWERVSRGDRAAHQSNHHLDPLTGWWAN